jgi:hypothetical protein
VDGEVALMVEVAVCRILARAGGESRVVVVGLIPGSGASSRSEARADGGSQAAGAAGQRAS